MKRKLKEIRTILLPAIFFVILIGIIIIFWKPLTQFFSNAENIREFVSSFGILAPLIFIVIVILQVLLAPIPGQIVGLAGGYTFGVILGTIYGMIGLMLGSFIIFCLSRKYGRPLVKKVVNKKIFNKYDKIISKKGLPVLFLIFLLPIFPDDITCYIAGLTKIKIKNLMLVSAIGRFPGFLILSIVGNGLAYQNTFFSALLFASMMLVSVIVYLKRNELEKIMFRIVEKLKK